MKHCHCGLREHFASLRLKKLGALGAVLMILHLLFHVVECLLVPAILVAIHQQSVQAEAAARPVTAEALVEPVLGTSYLPLRDVDFAESRYRYEIPLRTGAGV